MSCLDSVAAAVKYPGWAVAGVGSEAEEEAGAGSWLTPGVAKMAHRCRWLLRWMAKGCVADSKPMIGHIGGAVTML